MTDQISKPEKGPTELKKELTASKRENTRLRNKLTAVEKQLADLQASIGNNEDNFVKFILDRDMETITPVVGYRKDVFDDLFKAGLISDAMEGKDYAIQLALISIVVEAGNQLVDAFSPGFDEE